MRMLSTALFARSGDEGSRTSSLVGRLVTAAVATLIASNSFGQVAIAQTAQSALSPEIMALHLQAKRGVPERPQIDFAAARNASSLTFNSDQGPGFGPRGPGAGCNLFPAPAGVGAKVPLSYFGPPPSDVNKSFVGPVQLLNSGKINVHDGTITLPLYRGTMVGTNKTVWYILTDVSDSNVAESLGLNFSAKLNFLSLGARTANLDGNGNLVFNAGTVDFSPVRNVVPGPPGAEFPPVSAQPGAIGDADYSPYVQILNAGNVIYNAPIVAFDAQPKDINFPHGNVDYSKVNDQVLAINPFNMTVTLNLINGFSFGRPVWYLSTDASIALAAAIEHSTFAPLMQKIPLDHDDSFGSAVERIFISTNGPEDGSCNNPLRQTLPMDTDPTMLWAAFQPSRWTTVRHGMHSCMNGLRAQLAAISAAKCGKSSKF